jgi:hypothetical protein
LTEQLFLQLDDFREDLRDLIGWPRGFARFAGFTGIFRAYRIAGRLQAARTTDAITEAGTVGAFAFL